jgi:hypothetical protein
LDAVGPVWTATVVLVNRGLGVRVPPSALVFPQVNALFGVP